MSVILHQTRGKEVPQHLAERWKKIPVAVTVDLDPSIRQIDPLIRPINFAREQTLLGKLVTAKCEPPDFGAVLHSLDILEKGDVLVIAANGHDKHAMIGDILSGHLRNKGIAGVVCDGAVRDTGSLRGFDDFPVYARMINPRGPASADKGEINANIKIGDISILPGEYIIGDADGLVVLAPYEMAQYIEAAEARLALEEEWQLRLAKGEKVTDIFGLEKPILK